MIITIDGPVASGKSTIARMLAQKLDYYYLYSGLLYRAVAYAALQAGIDLDSVTTEDVDRFLSTLVYTYNAEHGQKIFFSGHDITTHLMSIVVSDAASRISVFPCVRDKINAWQHVIAADHDIIVDGRDSGTIVFAHADVKFFLEVPLELRAQRWLAKEIQLDATLTIDDACAYIAKRDQRDTQRAIAPLRVALDAFVVDNSGTAEEALAYIVHIIQQNFSAKI